MRSRFSLLLTACGSAPPPSGMAALAVNIAGVPNDAVADVTVTSLGQYDAFVQMIGQ
ncbi:hypothetical protein GCM10010840_08940 [Deinococcus aerolatus]|uniref:Uncharacterized protein n=1 Tax=Deinococcus aerolatus TaxID=522487 RepID=A0ABQ2G363_9DEIO|nr:hypothetical protein [Deinococcus aerolatus]GGL73117.1 hypothetical protein GCM10010840_08940 [Deinococcus aerolatus]